MAPASVFAEEELRIQRYLEGLMLGDQMRQIQVVFPKKGAWPKTKEPDSKLNRIHLREGAARYFPTNMDEIDLGMRRKGLVSIRIIYSRAESRRKPLGEVVIDYSLVYGEPRRYEETYFWFDRRTVLAVYHTEKVSSGSASGRRRGGRRKAVVSEMFVTVELMKRKYFKPLQ